MSPISRVATINTLDAEGRVISHSAMYAGIDGRIPADRGADRGFDRKGKPMSVPVLHEGEVEELDLRAGVCWLIADGRSVRQCSACVMRIA